MAEWGNIDREAIVVGASSAGLLAARDLARAGMKTLVVDSRPSFDEPERTWIVTPRIQEMVDLDLKPCLRHRTGTMELITGELSRSVRLREPDWIIERAELRRLLAKAAREAGAEIELGRRVQSIGPGAGVCTASLNGRGRPVTEIRARHVIGADGVKSVVANAIGSGSQKTVPIVQARVRLPEEYDPDVTRVWFKRNRTRFFYWLIPENDATGVLGLIAEQPKDARTLLDAFMDDLGYEPLEYQGAMIPLHRPFRKLEENGFGGRILLVGDAASHVKVTTVGGVVSGLWGARAAARALIGQTSYAKELRALHRELWVHDTIRWVLDRFQAVHYARMLGLLNTRLYEILGRHNRDNMAPQALDLVRAQPRILSLALHSLFSGGFSSEGRSCGSAAV